MLNSGRNARRLIFLCLLLAATPGPAHAEWLEASSDHFIVYSDMSEKRLHKFATDLERFDRGLSRIFQSKYMEDKGRRSNRLKIYVVSSIRELQIVYGDQNSAVAGFYVPRVGGSVAFTPRDTGREFMINSQVVLLHEYAHHFMFSKFAAAYPRWFAEGFAELAATARFEQDGRLSFGLPANDRIGLLSGPRVLDMDELLDISGRPDELTERQNAMVYARGWLLTHFLIFSPERLVQLKAYLDAVNLGTPSLDAGKAAFGDLAKLDAEIDRYKSKPLRYVKLTLGELSIGPITIRPLSAGERAMMPTHMRSTRGVSREDALELLPKARKVAAKYPNDSQVQAHLAEAEFDAGNLGEADAAADRALAADPRSIKALLYKGRIAVRRAMAARSTDENTWKSARNWYLKANAVDNNTAEALYLYYTSFLAANVEPPKNAVLALNRAFELSPEDKVLRIQVAHQALNDGNSALARAALTPIAFAPHANRWRSSAAGAIALIREGKTGEARNALVRPPADGSQDRESDDL